MHFVPEQDQSVEHVKRFLAAMITVDLPGLLEGIAAHNIKDLAATEDILLRPDEYIIGGVMIKKVTMKRVCQPICIRWGAYCFSCFRTTFLG